MKKNTILGIESKLNGALGSLKTTGLGLVLATGLAGCASSGKYSINNAQTNSDFAHIYVTQMGTNAQNLREGCFENEEFKKRYDSLGAKKQEKGKLETELVKCGYEQRELDSGVYLWTNTALDVAKLALYVKLAKDITKSSSSTSSSQSNLVGSGSGQGGQTLSGGQTANVGNTSLFGPVPRTTTTTSSSSTNYLQLIALGTGAYLLVDKYVLDDNNENN
jgi:hypothetical protein